MDCLFSSHVHGRCYRVRSVIKKQFVIANSINSSFHQCFVGLSNNVVTLLVEYKNGHKCQFSAGFNFYHGIPEKPGIIMGLVFSSPNKIFCEGQKRQATKRKVALDAKKAVSS